MNLLALDTSTETLSVAVQAMRAGRPQVWQHNAPGGAQTSTTLIPLIQGLMAAAGLQFGQLEAIAFGSGPGSFTGLRTACAVAQGLGFGANVKVLAVDTLLAVAEEARWRQGPTSARLEVMALLDARMDEIYAARYGFDAGRWQPCGESQLLRPEQLLCEPGVVLAGNVFAVHGARLSGVPAAATRLEVLPSAGALLRLAPALLAAGAALAADQALPRYIRDKVAKTSQERALEKMPPAGPSDA